MLSLGAKSSQIQIFYLKTDIVPVRPYGSALYFNIPLPVFLKGLFQSQISIARLIDQFDIFPLSG